MQFEINRDLLLKSLNFVQGVVEKKNTLPILSNVLLNLKNNKLEIIATDLDIVFYDEISELKVVEEGNTTTSANVLFDILRKIPAGTEINFTLKSENKLSLKSKNSESLYYTIKSEKDYALFDFSKKFDRSIIGSSGYSVIAVLYLLLLNSRSSKAKYNLKKLQKFIKRYVPKSKYSAVIQTLESQDINKLL